MGQLDELGVAFLAGMVCGFVVSVPVGPVNLTVIHNALRKGFLSAFLAGTGAIVAETVYAMVMLAGHSTLLDKPAVAFVLRVIAVVVIWIVGMRNLLIKVEQVEEKSVAKAKQAMERWHHPKSFLLGFVLTITNLMLVLLWATLAAVLFAREWVQPELPSRSACLAGVMCGGVVWFALLAFFVSRAHRRVSPRTLTYFVRACGVVFLIFAALLAYRLFVPAKPGRGVDLLRRAS